MEPMPAMISYAQNAEDVVLARALGTGPGFYVDVGAADPLTASVTRHFYELGWRGINIDPRSEAVEELQRTRPRDINLTLGAGDFDGYAALRLNQQDPDLSHVDFEVDDDVGARVAVSRLDTILATHAVPAIDFLKIDVEGAEERVLRGIDLRRWQPRVVVVEAVRPWSHTRTDGRWRHLLEAAGYREGCFDGVNIFFGRESEPGVVAALRPASVLDDFTPYSTVLLHRELHELRDHVKHTAHELDLARKALTDAEQYARSLEAALGEHPGSRRDSAHRRAGRASVEVLAKPARSGARVAILGSPRTGNTWLRRVLADAFGAGELSVHHPGDIPWERLPEQFVIQLHWPRTKGLEQMLRIHDIQVISIARHPLDVLLSVLQFAQREPNTGQWLGGAGGDECCLSGASASDAAFRQWATTERARLLLDVTPQWWSSPGAIRVRYEDLSREGLSAFERVAAMLEVAVDGDLLRRAHAVNTPERLSELSGGVHVWKATAGMWREVLTVAQAALLSGVHRGTFDALGYERVCDPDLPTADASGG